MNRFFSFNLILCIYFFLQSYGYCSNSNIERARNLIKEKKYEKAFELFMTMADKSNSEAQYYIASMYAKGCGVRQDLPEAFTWFKISAENGYADSIYILSLMYWGGIGTKKNNDLALKMIKVAAIKGHKKAQQAVIALYCAGFIAQIEDAETINWLKASAEENDSLAQFALGMFYVRLGNGQNIKQGLFYIKKSALQNNSGALYFLAQTYCDKEDSSKAFELLILSAQNGASDARVALGILCISINKNSLAEKWFQLAANTMTIPISLDVFRDYGKKLRNNFNLNKKLESIFAYVSETLGCQYSTNMLDKANFIKSVKTTCNNCDPQLLKDTIKAFRLNIEELSIKQILEKRSSGVKVADGVR